MSNRSAAQGPGEPNRESADAGGEYSGSFRPPQQERSRQTLSRMASAAEELLADRSFEEVTVDEIASRAGVSKGAFYARFDSKQALFRYLSQDRFQSVLDDWSEFLAPESWEGRTLAEFGDRLVERVLKLYQRHEPVMREFVRRARLDTEAAVRERAGTLNQHILEGTERVIQQHADSLAHPECDRAVEYGLNLVRAMVADYVLLTPAGNEPEHRSDEEFVEEVARMLRRYWGFECPR